MCITSLSNFWRCKVIKEFKIEKTDTHVSIYICLVKKTNRKQMAILFETKDALALLKKECPDLKFVQKPEKQIHIENTGKNNCATWKFALIKEQPKPALVERPRLTRKQRREALAELTQLTEEAGGYDQEIQTENREKPDLTEAETCDKVDEAEEKAE